MQRITNIVMALSLGSATACALDGAVGPSSPGREVSAASAVIQASAWTIAPLPFPAGFSQAAALQINASGKIVGTAWNTTGVGQPVAWTGGVPSLVSVPPGFVGGSLHDISDAGQMVGLAYTALGASRAFRVSGSSVVALYDLGFGSVAFAIGGLSNGYIVGTITDASGSELPVRWSTRFLTYTFLPLPSGHVGGLAADINATGDIVGSVYSATGASSGYVWKSNGTAQFVVNYPTSIVHTVAPDGTIGFDGTVVGVSAPPYVANTVVWSAGNVWSINSLNRVVGHEGGAPATWRGNIKTLLPTLLGETHAWARGITTCGTIVGEAGGVTGATPVRWSRTSCEL